MNCVYDQPVFIYVLMIGMGRRDKTRSIWLYFEELLLQAGVNGKEGSGVLLQAL